ncbi:MAG: hypothetical protein FD119_112 [Stygiobacter sp.]|nr:MAG: hypothetical protein FD119_112 [Stygiobacter sp.]
MSVDPGAVLDKTDPGADVQGRFSYQHCYAAIQCLRLIDGELDAVFCENHEDILLRKCGGQYEALQIKTRRFDLEPFAADDDEVLKSIGRFAKLERTYPDRFDAFHFVTNHGFRNDKASGKNIQYVRDEIVALGTVDGLTKANKLRKFVIAASAVSGCSESDVVAALKKLVLSGHQTDLERPFKDLREVVGETRDFRKTQTLDTVSKMADNLLFLCYRASSSALGGGVADLYGLAMDFDAQRDALLLTGKEITADMVEQVIADSLVVGADNLLVSSGGVSADVLPPGFDVMVEKLEGGGLQMARVDLLKDYKASLETMYMKWLHRHGPAVANERLGHIKAQVKDDCVEAQIEAEQPGQKYASTMYAELRSLLEHRLATTSLPLFDCSREHLLGAAAMLTEECQVWWSDKFALKSTQ